MNQNKRILIAVVILLTLIGGVLGIDYIQRRNAESKSIADAPAGSIPIYVDGNLAASFIPTDLEKINLVSFMDAEEGKTQEGWLLAEVLKLYTSSADLQPTTEIIVSSSSRDKSAAFSWAEVENLENMILFDLSGRGTLKLVSQMEGFDIRENWIQDVDKIEVTLP